MYVLDEYCSDGILIFVPMKLLVSEGENIFYHLFVLVLENVYDVCTFCVPL